MRILIVEDDKNIAKNISEYLNQNNFTVDISNDGEQGLIYAKRENTYDVIILDINLPGIDGLTICNTLRKKNINTPILFLTSKDTIDDKIIGLNVGADDYLVKPFSLRELLARLQALIRRNYNIGSNIQNNILKYGGIVLDDNIKSVSRDGKTIKLTKKEYQILQLFMLRNEKLLTKNEIQQHIRGNNSDLRSDVIRTHIQILKKKIDKGYKKILIHNIHGMGYILTTNQKLNENY